MAICGDSITEQKLYSVYIEDYMLMCQPQLELEAMQFGWAGETAYLFERRQKTNCMVFKPTAATICYGMNDAGYLPTKNERLDLYQRKLTEIIVRFKEAGMEFIVLGSPTVVDSDTFKQLDAATYNTTLADFTQCAMAVAGKQDVAFVNIHETMMDVMAKAKAKYGKKYAFVGTGVHPGPNGHLVIAYSFLKAMGFSGEIGTITLDLKNNNAAATEGHRIISAANGSIEVESTRYPFCFYGELDQQTTRSAAEFIPFNEDLNRYKLVVKNAPTSKLKVTWGKGSKEYSAADLENGINLAADFWDNPFSDAFAQVEKVITEQQSFETKATKIMLHALPEWRAHFPDQEASYDKMENMVIEKDKMLRQKARAAVAPVRHTIKVEPCP